MTESLQQRLIRHEGIVLHEYKDSLGYLTVGVGHLITPEDGDTYDTPITRAEAITVLQSDITKAIIELSKSLPWASKLDPARHDVLIELCFWLGIGGLLGFKHMLADLQRLNYDGAAQELLNSELHKQCPARCEELAGILLSGNS